MYTCIVITGIATIWYHGFGETLWQGTTDISTNLLLAWILQLAVTYDHTPNKKMKIGIIISGILITAYILFRTIGGILIGDALRTVPEAFLWRLRVFLNWGTPFDRKFSHGDGLFVSQS